MPETEYSGFGGQYHACWCPGSLSRQGISRNDIDSIVYATFRLLHCDFGLLLLNKIQDKMRNFYKLYGNSACLESVLWQIWLYLKNYLQDIPIQVFDLNTQLHRYEITKEWSS